MSEVSFVWKTKAKTFLNILRSFSLLNFSLYKFSGKRFNLIYALTLTAKKA